MLLIADSGSTKTDWCLVEHGEVLQRIETKGMNPFFQTEEEMEREVKTVLWPQLKIARMAAVYFYGAGCTPEKGESVRRVLQRTLPVDGEIEVHSDMLGAARALCGYLPDIACILGTGSNSCFYDGARIQKNVSPLGFILGDEGSGANLGKLLVSDVLKRQLPEKVCEAFVVQYGFTVADVIDRVYRKPFPNRFLASFAPFLAQHREVPQVKALVTEAFKAFFRRNVMQYEGWQLYKAHFVGSVAYHFEAELRQAAIEVGVTVGTVTKSPMDGLVRYYQ